jgi:hypothetical protein
VLLGGPHGAIREGGRQMPLLDGGLFGDRGCFEEKLEGVDALGEVQWLEI